MWIFPLDSPVLIPELGRLQPSLCVARGLQRESVQFSRKQLPSGPRDWAGHLLHSGPATAEDQQSRDGHSASQRSGRRCCSCILFSDCVPGLPTGLERKMPRILLGPMWLPIIKVSWERAGKSWFLTKWSPLTAEAPWPILCSSRAHGSHPLLFFSQPQLWWWVSTEVNSQQSGSLQQSSFLVSLASGPVCLFFQCWASLSQLAPWPHTQATVHLSAELTQPWNERWKHQIN